MALFEPLDLHPIERKWVVGCDKCGQWTSVKSGGICYKASDSWGGEYIDGALCKKCRSDND